MNKRVFAFIFLLSGCQLTPQKSAGVLPETLEQSFLLAQYQYLSSDKFQGRKVGTPASIEVQNHLIEVLKAEQVKPFNRSYRHSFVIKKWFGNSITGNNVVGVIPSKDASTNYIALTAHFDHLGKIHNKIFNGADDNASGIAALLAIAKALKYTPPKHNILLIITDGEESDLKGIQAFLKQNQALIKQIKLNINMDMLAGSKSSKKLHFISKDLDSLLSKSELNSFKVHRQYSNFKVKRGFDKKPSSSENNISWLRASDHYAFYLHNIPFIYYGVGVHNNYHTAKDTYENSNKSLLINASNYIYQQLMYLDSVI